MTRQWIAIMLCMALATTPMVGATDQNASSASANQTQDAALSPKELDNLVSPIALYPDSLVAQILAGATYPDQITAANEWLKANSKLKDQALMEAVDKQPWDPSVKALTQFPSVLDQLATNLSWTSALGEASYYQQKDVMAAIQRLRKQAKDAGNLKSGEQIKVVQQDPQTIIIQPSNPQVVYVPQYNPTVVYGVPYYPPYYPPASYAATAMISFGVGMMVGAAISGGCCGWGWGGGGWGCGWHGGTVNYQKNVYVSNSNNFQGGNRNRVTQYDGSRQNAGNRQTAGNRQSTGTRPSTTGTPSTRDTGRQGAAARPSTGTSSREAWRQSGASAPSAGNRAQGRPSSADRGYGGAQSRGGGAQTRGGGAQSPGGGGGAFSGYNKGGSAGAQSSRGRSSMGGSASRSRPSGGRSGGGRRR